MIAAEDIVRPPSSAQTMPTSTPNKALSKTNGQSSNYLSSLAKDNQQQQTQKDRTLFCINIDQKCTEDILYELFLQVGPIENITRKADRNGNLICLITYKHIESCDYAIRLFNGISLFNQPLKVQQSQPNAGASSQSLNRSSSTNLTSLANQQPVNHYQNLNNRDRDRERDRDRDRDRSRQSMDSSFNNNNNIQMDPNQVLNMIFSLAQQQQQQQQQSPVPLMMPPQSLMGNFNNQQIQFNRSRSGPNLQDFENSNGMGSGGQHHSRRDGRGAGNFHNNNSNYDNRRDNSRNNSYNNRNNGRDSSYQNNSRQNSRDHSNRNVNNNNSRSRSRSPRRNQNNRR